MTFECNDLDRALQEPKLPQEAVSHAEVCPACASRLRLWREIYGMAPELKEEWETPGLWPRIATAMETEPARRTMWWGKSWKLHSAVAAAAVLVIAVLLRHSEVTAPPPLPASKEFLTAETFGDIERTRAAYVQAIEKLAAAAGHGLESSSTPLAAVYREKILLLDSAIADLKSGVKENPYNVYLQNQLALLYQEKEKTLKEWLENEKNN